MSSVKKKFNWKKAISIFFTVVVILRVGVYVFGNDAPSCTSSETKQKVSKLVNRILDRPEYEGVFASIVNHREISSVKEGRICEADVTITDNEGHTIKGVRKYEIKKDGKNYTLRLD